MATDHSSDERFDALFAAHHHEIQAFCLRRLPLHDANEAAADVFTVAWRRIASVPEGEQALPWLFGVARNVVRNHQRSSMRRIRLAAKAGAQGEQTQAGPETHVVRNSEAAALAAALAAMRESDQELLRLKTWERLTNKAIGDILDISEQAVESRYARALKRLAKRLQPTTTSHATSPLSNPRGEEAT